jgi:hypothetical protein
MMAGTTHDVGSSSKLLRKTRGSVFAGLVTPRNLEHGLQVALELGRKRRLAARPEETPIARDPRRQPTPEPS